MLLYLLKIRNCIDKHTLQYILRIVDSKLNTARGDDIMSPYILTFNGSDNSSSTSLSRCIAKVKI